MENPELYEFTINETFSWNYLHILLTIAEYFFTIFPYLSSSIRKLRNYQQPFFYSKTNSFFIFFQNSKKLFLTKKKLLSVFCIYLYFMVSLLLILLIIDLLLSFSYSKKKEKSLKCKIFVNIINFLFRYFSFYFIDVLQCLIIANYSENKTTNYFIRIIFMCFQVIYCLLLYRYITEFTFNFRITNQRIIQKYVCYPFDVFGEKYCKFILLLKIIIAFESNYLISQNFFIGKINFFVNIFLIFLSIASIFVVFFESCLFYGIQGNFTLFFVRKFFIFFGVVNIITQILSSELIREDSYFEFSNFILSFFVTLFILFIKWFFIDFKKIKLSIEKFDGKFIIYFLLNQQTKENENGKKEENSLNFYLLDIFFAWFKICHNIESPEDPQKKDESCDEIFLFFQKYQEIISHLDSNQSLILNFLFSCATQSIFNINKYYFKLVGNSKDKLSKSLKSTITYIYMQRLYDNRNITNFYLNEIMKITEFNFKMQRLLKNFNEFINENLDNQKGTTLLDISKRIYSLKKEFKKIYEGFITNYQKILIVPEFKNFNKINSQGLKNIPDIYKYSTIIYRFILENLINEEFLDMSRQNIETFEDFLQFHYSNDNLLILSTNSSENDIHFFKVIEITGKIKRQNIHYFYELLPKEFAREGRKKLIDCLSSKKGKTSNYTYEFISNIHEYYEHFQYNFEISQTLFNNKLILLGFYFNKIPSTVVLSIKNNEKVRLVKFSREVARMIRITPKIFNSLFKKKKQFLLEDFFVNVNFSIIPNKGFSFENINKITCELQYSKYFQVILKEFKEKIKNCSQNELHAFEEEFERIKKDSLLFQRQKFDILFEKLFLIDDYSHCLFKFTYENKTQKNLRLIYPSFISYSRSPKGPENCQMLDPFFINRNFLKLGSIDSVAAEKTNTEEASSSKSLFKIYKLKVYKMTIVQKELNKISFLTFFSFLINIILIILCVAFLFAQIYQVKLISKTNVLSYDFKTLRHYFYSVFYSLTSLTCLEKDPSYPSIKCENLLINYLNVYEKKINFKEFLLSDLLWYGFGSKINTLKTYYSSLKKKLSTKQFTRFQFLLSSDIIFYFLEQKPDEIIQVTNKIKFDVAIESTINTYFTLYNGGKNKEEFLSSPYYIISMLDSTFQLSQVKNQNWNFIQRETFKIISNILNFGKTFNEGDKIISDFFDKNKKNNLIFSVFFMILFILLNAFILVINLQITKLWHLLFKKVIIYIFLKTSKEKDYLSKKLEYLIELSDLYKINPNGLVRSIEQEKKNYKRNYQKEKTVDLSKLSEAEKRKNKLILAFQNDNSYQMKEFTHKFIKPLYFYNILLFLVYFFIILIFDIIIIIIILSVYSFRTYIIMNYDFETYLYADISIVHLFRLFNTTEEEIAMTLEKENGDDGIINQYIRNSFHFLSQINKNAKVNNYPSEKDYFDLSCDNLFTQISDEIYIEFQKHINSETNDPFALPKIICKDMNFDKFFNFVYEDYIILLHNIHSKYSDRTFTGMYALLEDENFYKIYFYLFFYIRPLKSAFDKTALIPVITKKFALYTTLIWIYLLLNLFLETLLFLINKLFISQKAKNIEKRLFLFYQCL